MGTRPGANCPAHWSLYYPMRACMLSRVGPFATVDCSPLGSSVHGILQARITGVGCQTLLQGICLTQGQNPFSCLSCTAGGFFDAEPRPRPLALPLLPYPPPRRFLLLHYPTPGQSQDWCFQDSCGVRLGYNPEKEAPVPGRARQVAQEWHLGLLCALELKVSVALAGQSQARAQLGQGLSCSFKGSHH